MDELKVEVKSEDGMKERRGVRRGSPRNTRRAVDQLSLLAAQPSNASASPFHGFEMTEL